MCGLAGLLAGCSQYSKERITDAVVGMTEALHHRGPDASGLWSAQGIALGHRRLSILDLSSEGSQPMLSACGRYVISYNGEIYNFTELRQELGKGGAQGWRGHSDTEVMLAAISQWGLEAAVKRFVGMFAFAVWDREKRSLHLVRDRFGEKPLYYGWVGDSFLFASELKALKAFPGWQGKIDRNALTLFLRHNYIPAPYSIYQDIFKLRPSSVLTLRQDTMIAHTLPEPSLYWSAREMAEAGVANLFTGSEDAAVGQVDKLLREAVRQQMVADVPLGAFLSGGVDSSLVVALMQTQSSRPVQTFTIGFNEQAYNEADHARAVARHLGTEHTELYVTPREAMAVIPRLSQIYDEPFADSSQIPTFLVAQLARQSVAVSLSGDGGDELFGGYNRYSWAKEIWRKTGWLPQSSRRFLGRLLAVKSPQAWDACFQQIGSVLPRKFRQRMPGDKLHKLADILAADSPESMYLSLVSHWKHPVDVVSGAHEPVTLLTGCEQWVNLSDSSGRMMFLDAISYLPDDILAKVDRACMSVSLESRTPFLDHRVFEFAWTVPMSMKIRNNEGKWILRQVLDKYIPRDLIDRPKMGFGVPIGEWLRGPLRMWAEELLDAQRLSREGFFNPEPIQQKWREHLSGQRNWQHHLWGILMFQAWLESE